MSLSVRIVTTVLPVVAFLVSLLVLDSFKLVRPVRLLIAGLAGAAAAFASLFLNAHLQTALGWDLAAYARFAAPAVEEVLKALFVVHLVRTRRVAFPVDAAILGFATGTGFAIVESMYFLNVCPLSPLECILRSFGTAVMHGTATAVVGIVALTLSERFVSIGSRVLVPALAVGYAAHALFNLLIVSPVLTVLGLVIVLPVLFLLVFRQSDRVLHNWLRTGLDSDFETLEMIDSGEVSNSHIGKYLAALKESFPPEVVGNMLCILRLRVELSMRAKGVLLLKEAGYTVPVDPEDTAKLEELQSLERNVGRAGMLAMAPLLRWRTRDAWEHHLLRKR